MNLEKMYFFQMHEIDVMNREDTLTAYELSCDVAVFVTEAPKPSAPPLHALTRMPFSSSTLPHRPTST